MSSSSPHRFQRGLIVGITAVLIVAMPARASAHTELDFAYPGPGAEFGGKLDWIQLTFFGLTVSDPEITVRAPDSTVINGNVVEVENTRVTYEMDPFEVEGQYIVEWAVTATDGERSESAYAFTYDLDAPPMERVPVVITWQWWLVIAAALVALAYGMVLLVRRAQQTRFSTADED